MPIEDAAIEITERNRRELFPDAPIVFLAVNPRDQIANATGVYVNLDFSGSLALATSLQPGIRQVFVVAGASERDKLFENMARQQFGAFERRLAFTYLSGLPTIELEQQLAALPEASVVFYVLVSQDSAGVNVRPLDYLDRITTIANRPIYSWLESAMDHGVVGGRLLHTETVMDQLSDKAVRVLRAFYEDSGEDAFLMEYRFGNEAGDDFEETVNRIAQFEEN